MTNAIEKIHASLSISSFKKYHIWITQICRTANAKIVPWITYILPKNTSTVGVLLHILPYFCNFNIHSVKRQKCPYVAIK